ncbi:cofilin-1-like [Cebus imitator]|uniref:cofilin-1-like n=1 Tax=Cebus imitator TaxID=2715852 RepID=UPI00189A2AB4|nr:cofilin-1-like [Cebus imitator]
MASGVAISDGVIKVFTDLKVGKSSTPEEVKQHRKVVLLFCLTEDETNTTLEEGEETLVDDVCWTTDHPYATFAKMLQTKTAAAPSEVMQPETQESKEDLAFIFWAPESAPLKGKMAYASSKDDIKKKVKGIKHEQGNCYQEVKDGGNWQRSWEQCRHLPGGHAFVSTLQPQA